jgi:acyl-CoA oxidase
MIKTTAQSQSIIVTTFFQALSNDTTLPIATKAILWDLYRLFALNTMENEGYECK